MKRSSAGVIALLALAACDQKKGAAELAAERGSAGSAAVTSGRGSAAGSGSGSSTGSGSAAVAAAATDDPWDTKPGDIDTRIGEKTGNDLSKIDPWDAAPPPTTQPKVDVTKIEKPVENKVDQVDIPTLGGGAAVGAFTVTYNPGKAESHNQFKALFEKDRIFEQVAEGLNKTIRMPTSIAINTVSCNTINAFYDPRNKRIIVCYELFDYFLGLFKPKAKDDAELGSAVMGAAMFGFFHEVGHGLIDVLDLASTGREEDAVDELATLTLMGAGDEGVQMAVSGAYWFKLQSETGHKTPFWDEHAFDEQRFYNIICLIYGSDPRKFSGFVSSGNLPSNRALRCPDEYAKKKKAWEKLLSPHLTNAASINVGYKPSVPLAEQPKTTNQDPWDEDPTAGAPKLPPVTSDTPAVPATGAITCEQVAERAVALIREESERRAAKMTPAELIELRAKLASELPAVQEKIISQCAKEQWTESSRKCVIDATSYTEATKCK